MKVTDIGIVSAATAIGTNMASWNPTIFLITAGRIMWRPRLRRATSYPAIIATAVPIRPRARPHIGERRLRPTITEDARKNIPPKAEFFNINIVVSGQTEIYCLYMKTVLVFGTFDLLHPGHKWFLRHAAGFGNRLAVVVARDKNVIAHKNRAPVWDENRRLTAVGELPFVDEAFLGYEDWSKHGRVLEKIKPDVIVLGYDQKAKIPPGNWVIVRLPAHHPEKYKTSIIRR